MRAKRSRHLVIDASVARSAGDEGATYPISKQCRDFLQTTLTVCHHAVFTPLVYAEWKKHQSKFARKWRVAMVARKKLEIIAAEEDAELRDEVDNASANERDRLAMSKDIHLIEAARATDCIVVSLDETVRRLFAGAAHRVPVLQPIVWANPGRAIEDCLTWLEEGAALDDHRRLGSWGR